MSKYSVNGIEIVDDSGKIDWNKIKNHPLVSNVSNVLISITNCGTGGTVGGSVTTSGTVKTVNLSVTGGGAPIPNCDCNCLCLCACGACGT